MGNDFMDFQLIKQKPFPLSINRKCVWGTAHNEIKRKASKTPNHLHLSVF